MTALDGVVQRVVFQSGSFFVFDFLVEEAVDGRRLWTARGHLFGLQGVTFGVSLRVKGAWGRHPRYGRQFRVRSWEPWYKDSSTFCSFLTHCIRGADALSAGALCERYGEGVIDAMSNHPARVLEEVACNRQDLQSTLLGWEQAVATCNLSHFLKGLSAYEVEAIISRLGPTAASLLRSDPYRLLQIPGFDFLRADEFAAGLGFPKQSPERVGGAVLWALDSATRSGHLFLAPDQLPVAALDIPLDEPVQGDYAQALRRLSEEKMVRVEAGRRVYLPEFFEYERRSANHIAARLRSASGLDLDAHAFLAEFEATSRLCLSQAQRDVVDGIMKSRALVVTGLPGTGKSTSVRALVSLFQKAGISFSLMAPTGIAAKRLSLITDCPASTVHRALAFDGTVWGHGPNNRYLVDAVIVDEMSMVDQELLYRLLVSLRDETLLVLVGDAAQLPSVGPGNVLRELAACAELPTVKLTEIFRQASQGDIVSNSHRINRGEFPELGDPMSDSEFKFMQLQDGHQVRDCIVRMAKKLKARDANFQVLTAKYRGVVGVDALNKALREALNPPGPPEWKGDTQHFRVGDRIMVVRNDYHKHVYNGDVGKLLAIEQDKLIVRIYGLREEQRQVAFTEEHAEEKLRLAYAVTVHRCQGNEFDTILMPLSLEQGRMLQRNLFYTGVTRARHQVWLFGQKAAIQRAIDNNKVTRRNTVLARAISGVLRREEAKGEPRGTAEDRANL